MNLEAEEFKTSQKSRILEYQFDEYDDEYDDTYDSTDIKWGAAGDDAKDAALDVFGEKESQMAQKEATQNTPGGLSATPQERLLVETYHRDPSLFDPSQRKTKLRDRLKESTGMSDEQLEGWFKMLERNPRKEAYLLQFEWRGNHAPEEPSGVNSSSDKQSQRKGGQEQKTPSTRGRGRGNVNRKTGHARKMAKGMGPIAD